MAERTRCLYCNAKLRKALLHGVGYDGNGIFCTLRCGFLWALRKVNSEEGI